MTMTLLKVKQESQLQQSILKAWQDAHGTKTGRVYLCWGDTHLTVIMEDTLLKAEQLLAQTEEGKDILGQYLQELLAQIIESNEPAWSQMLGRVIVDTTFFVNPDEQLMLIIFQLGE